MRATNLKKKYPDIWQAVESQVIFDINNNATVKVKAHNAAFIACSKLHNSLKSKGVCKRVVK